MTHSEIQQDDRSSIVDQERRPVRSWHWGRILAGGYILLIAMAAGYVTYRLTFAPIRSPFAGIIMIILGWPWSRPLGGFLVTHGPLGVLLILGLSYVLNAFVLFMLGGALQQLFRRGR